MKTVELSPGLLIQEYELFEDPKENHIRLDQIGKLICDGYYHSSETNPILVKRKTLSEEERQKKADKVIEIVDSYAPYVYTAFAIEINRIYGDVCWQFYKEKEKISVEPGLFERSLRDLLNLGDEEQKEETTQEIAPKKESSEELITENRGQHEDTLEKETGETLQSDHSSKEELEELKQVMVEKMESISDEKTEEPKEENRLHKFDLRQVEFEKRMYKGTVLARHTEKYYEEHGEFPNPEDIEQSLKERFEREEKIIDLFFGTASKMESLDAKKYIDDYYFLFEDGYFVFFFGRSCYRFKVENEEFYLRSKKIDLEEFFLNLLEKRKRIWKHIIRLTKLFERKGIEYSGAFKEPFFMCHMVDEEEVIQIRYKNVLYNLCFDERHFYRMTGEVILEPKIIVHEVLEKSKDRKKAILKAKQFFKVFLTKSEKEEFSKKKSVLVQGQNYQYIIIPDQSYNPIIRICKETGEKKALCIMLDDPYIPKYDVMVSAMMYIKSGRENELNNIVNAFDLGEPHEKVLKQYAI